MRCCTCLHDVEIYTRSADGKGHTVYGSWCPSCRRDLREIRTLNISALKELARLAG